MFLYTLCLNKKFDVIKRHRPSCLPKYRKVFQDYLSTTAQYGEAGKHLSKMWIYEKVAEKNEIRVDWCRKIISYMLRNDGKIQDDSGE